MHKSLAIKIKKSIKNARIAKVYYTSERNEIRDRVALHFNTAMDSEGDENFDPAYVDKKFYGALPSGRQFLYLWDTDWKYRRKLIEGEINTFFAYWKQQGKIPNWMKMYEDDYTTIKKEYMDMLVSRYEEGIQRAKECRKKIVPEHYKFHNDDFFCTHIDSHLLWIHYGYYTYQRYWMRTIEPNAKGMAI